MLHRQHKIRGQIAHRQVNAVESELIISCWCSKVSLQLKLTNLFLLVPVLVLGGLLVNGGYLIRQPSSKNGTDTTNQFTRYCHDRPFLLCSRIKSFKKRWSYLIFSNRSPSRFVENIAHPLVTLPSDMSLSDCISALYVPKESVLKCTVLTPMMLPHNKGLN